MQGLANIKNQSCFVEGTLRKALYKSGVFTEVSCKELAQCTVYER